MLQELKIKTTQTLFTNAILKAKKNNHCEKAAIVLESDPDFNPLFSVFTENGWVKANELSEERQYFTIDELLNSFDMATLDGYKLAFKFDLNEEISELIKRYCKQYEMNPLSLVVQFRLKKFKKFTGKMVEKAIPTLYNGSTMVKEVEYKEMFEEIKIKEKK